MSNNSNNNQQVTPSNSVYTTDSPSMGMAVLGFFLPIVGLILWLVWKEPKPLKAKSAGKGALISVIVQVVLCILYAVYIGVMLSSLF
jgi:hypothetical protein